MANDEHVTLLKKGVAAWKAWRATTAKNKQVALLKNDVAAWNAWREENQDIRRNLNWADLSKTGLAAPSGYRLGQSGATRLGELFRDLSRVGRVDLSGANLREADLSGANLCEANLYEAILIGADLHGANLSGANLIGANLREANLATANLSGAYCLMANLGLANLSGTNLSGAGLLMANLTKANLSGANLREADLGGSTLVNADVTDADLTGCRIYGTSAWGLKLQGAKQQNLIISRTDEPEITVDNIEAAQFIYLLLHNEKLQRVIDTITTKVVLILGRFSRPERKEVLDALRSELRKPGRDYVPVVFDFEKPKSQTTINTIMLLARMARFVIADISDAKSV
jgi:uncharacterized protein YjbI with pentapeptide repeats